MGEGKKEDKYAGKGDKRMKEIEIVALHTKDGRIFIETKGRPINSFWMQIVPAGWGKFELFSKRTEDETKQFKGAFELVEVRQEYDPDPCQVASIKGVLWRRQEALEAEISICSYLSGLDRSEKYCPLK